MKPMLKAPRSTLEKVRCDGPLSNFAFKFTYAAIYWCFSTAGGSAPPAAEGAPALLLLERVAGEGFGGVKAGGPTWSLLDGAGQGLTLVHFSAQRNHFSRDS